MFHKERFTILLTVVIAIATACNPGERSFTVVNSCPFPLWVAEWWNYTSNSGSGGQGWKLETGEFTDLCKTAPWSGRFWGRTGCNFGEDGYCAGESACCDTGSCLASGTRFGLNCTFPGVPPVSLAEFTLTPYGQAPFADFYDISLVDGSSIPVEIAPKRGTFSAFMGDPYSCGSPGCTPLTCGNDSYTTPCPWKISSPVYGNTMKAVKFLSCDNSSTCATCDPNLHICGCYSDSDCPSDSVCGMNMVPGVGVRRACGVEIGWFSPGFVCSLDGGIQEPLYCSSSVNGQGTYSDLYSCARINSGSCYQNDASPLCCGCPSWSPGNECRNTNQVWKDMVEPAIKLFKTACPSAYSFPYDDVTSTFTCAGVSESNQVGYTITFCPAGSM